MPLIACRLGAAVLSMIPFFGALSGPAQAADPATEAASAHAFTFERIEGGALPLADFKGKPMLIVNTASLCGFTPQYKDLQALWSSYRDKGLVVIGVPSNDFGGQEPSADGKIKEFCEVTFGVDFPMTGKAKVKGPDAHPFYKWVAAQKGAPQWNFHKYLIDGEGRLVAAYGSMTSPTGKTLVAAIEPLLPSN